MKEGRKTEEHIPNGCSLPKEILCGTTIQYHSSLVQYSCLFVVVVLDFVALVVLLWTTEAETKMVPETLATGLILDLAPLSSSF